MGGGSLPPPDKVLSNFRPFPPNHHPRSGWDGVNLFAMYNEIPTSPWRGTRANVFDGEGRLDNDPVNPNLRVARIKLYLNPS